MAKTQHSDDSTLSLLRQIVSALEDKKAGDLRVLRVAEKSTITDYLVLATGTSEPHLRALRIEAEKVLDDAKTPIAGMDVGNYGSGWIVVDAYQIMLHFFTPEQREAYALEKLWKDAENLNLSTLLAEPKLKPEAKRKPAAVKKPAKPAAKVVTKAATKKPTAKKKAVVKKKAK